MKSTKGKEDHAIVLRHMSSMVFVGDEFAANMFDERDLFRGELDPEGQVKIGPIAQFSYSSRKYQFACTPVRIDLKGNSADVFPDDVVEAANTVAAALEKARRTVSVSGFGMNCDTVFDRRLLYADGKTFCLDLVNYKMSRYLFERSSFTAGEQFTFVADSVHFSVRIEPHWESNGERLFVAINGHQIVSKDDSLDSKITRVDVFREYVSSLHQRIIAIKGN